MAISKPMYNDLALRAPMILDRFRAILQDRDEDLRISDDDVVPPPDRDEIIRLYDLMLSELTFNSKPIITDLTIIAGEQREHGEGIAEAICSRIIEVPEEQKLPALYLLDSIIKNIGHEYIKHFSYHIPEVFCEAYRQVPQNLHPAMRHLFGTWATVFPHSVLQKIDGRLQFSLRGNQQPSGVAPLKLSESPRPTHGIHVNPKYLEGRGKLEPSTLDKGNQHVKQSPPKLQNYSQKPSIEYDEYDSDSNGEEICSQVGVQGKKSGGFTGTSFAHRATNLIAPPIMKNIKSASPQRNGFSAFMAPARDGVLEVGCSTVSTGKVSPSNLVVSYELDKTNTIDNGMSAWKRKHWAGDNRDVQDPRALIDAYGHDDREKPSDDRPIKVGRLDLSGLKGNMGSRAWQNSEEEEFDWEDMSPTLADRGRSTFPVLPSLPPLGRQGLGAQIQPYPSDVRRNDWPTQLHLGDAPSRIMQDRIFREPILSRTEQVNNHYESMATVPCLTSNEDSNGLSFFPPRPVFKEKFNHLTSQPTGLISFSRPSLFGSRIPLYNEEPREYAAAAMVAHDEVPVPLVASRGPFHFPRDEVPIPLVASRGPFHFKAPPLLAVRGHDVGAPPPLLNQVPYNHNGLPIARIPNVYPQLRIPMPLPLPPPSVPPQLTAAHSQPPNPAFSGLISTLMAQGLISLQNRTSEEDAIGVEFNPDSLKLRHEHAIKALYGDLPRQCTTCGLRFKSQEDHSSHMDWHVTKNRASKNRKQNTSRRWFVSSTMWLSTAEALGMDSTPGFLPCEVVVEQKDDDEQMAVPADEEQNTCALCGERFEDFYCDETDEWMYKGAVYMNAAPNQESVGMDKAQLGPIIHAKCRSESGMVDAQGLTQGGEENREIDVRKQEWR